MRLVKSTNYRELSFSAHSMRLRSRCSAGQGLTEYIIIVVVVAIVVLLGIRYFGSSVQNQFSGAKEEISSLGDSKSTNDSNDNGDRSSSSPVVAAGPGGGQGGGGGSYSSSDESASSSAGGMAGEIESLRSPAVGADPMDSMPEFSWGNILQFGGLVVLAGILVVFMGAKKGDKKGKKKKKKKKGESGQAMVEFVFIAITFLFVILGTIQLALILNAYALTRYAAYNAARAAIVHGGDPEKMKDAARLSLVSVFPRHGRADHVLGLTENYLAAKATDDDESYYNYTIQVNGSTVNRSKKITEVKILNNRGVESGEVVTFDDPAEGQKGLITVEVTHHYQMVMPLVNRILFFVYNRFISQKEDGAGGYAGETLMKLSADTDKMRRSGGMGNTEYRFPLTAHYTMRLQSDYERP